FRDQNGAFRNRQQLKKVSRLGEKTFEQAAGFLRVMNGDNPRDASAVHPEAYEVVESISAKTNRAIRTLIGDSSFLRSLKVEEFTTERFGAPTVRDILKELDKPGRDPRPEFRFATFQEGVEEIKDLKPGMVLEGSVTNVTNFGAFVDIGVHQDGLVHISALSHTFVKDPRDVVKAGDIVKVKVMEVDLARKRIALSMRLDDTPGAPSAEGAGRGPRREARAPRQELAKRGTSADLFAQAAQARNRGRQSPMGRLTATVVRGGGRPCIMIRASGRLESRYTAPISDSFSE